MLVVLSTTVVFLAFATWYLRKMNRLMQSPIPEAEALAGEPWTAEAVEKAHRRAKEDPIDISKYLPPRTGNRYIIVGGNGMLGGWIVLHLLQRGEDPTRIRILDNRSAMRNDLLQGLAAKVKFIQVDITDPVSTAAAFNTPWNIPSKDLPPLTVFHTAAALRFYERSKFLIPKNARVNVDGTSHVLQAARDAGASYLIYTSSGSVQIKSVRFWMTPWTSRIDGDFQILQDNAPPLGGHSQFVSNYAWTKYLADEMVRKHDGCTTSGGHELRTGVLRPGGMIFGLGSDQIMGGLMQEKTNPTWLSNTIQTHIYVENASLAHLNFEEALIETRKGNADVGGKAFLATDGNAATRFRDFYAALTYFTNGEVMFPEVPASLMLVLSHLVEAYHNLHHRLVQIPLIGKHIRSVMRSLEGTPLVGLQPAVFQTSCVSVVYDDRGARAPIAEGGLGYASAFSTLDGVAKLMEQYRRTPARSADDLVISPKGISAAQQGHGR